MGLLDVPASNRPNPRVLIDTDFNNGLGGFVQLTDHTQNIGVLGLASERTYGSSRFAMLLSTEDQPWGKTPAWQWSACTAIKRMGRGASMGRIKLDVWWALGSTFGQTAPRGVRFCIDQSDPSGNRRYFMYQYLNYDDLTNTRVSKWQVLCDKSGTGGLTREWVDVPGGAVELGYNENKRGLWHTEFVFDIAAARYDGLRLNGTGLGGGSLADGYGGPVPVNGANPMRALGSPLLEVVPSGNIDSFNSGLNITIDLVNRQNVTTSKAFCVVARCKLEDLT